MTSGLLLRTGDSVNECVHFIAKLMCNSECVVESICGCLSNSRLTYSIESISLSGFRSNRLIFGLFGEMGRLFLTSLEGEGYSCKHCQANLALAEDIISKDFYCKHGTAYLLKKVVNVTVGEKEDRMMITGKHTVADIFCVGCGSILGWKYEAAYEKLQKYKEGKFILERFKISSPHESPLLLDES